MVEWIHLRRRSGAHHVATIHPDPAPKRTAVERTLRPREGHRGWRGLGIVVLTLIVVLGVARAIMPWAVRDYVNRTLDRNPLYAGEVGPVEVHLWRGAYAIRDVRINKTTGNVPVPFFAAKRVDFAIQWDALLHRKVVGRLLMEEPEMNFVDAPSESEDQTGS